MVHVSENLMSNPAIAKALQRVKPKYPLCYCKMCQGGTQRVLGCANKGNPHATPENIWFRALRGEPIPAVDRKR